MVHELVLQNSNNAIECLLSEAWSAAILDSGATSTVCGQVWFDEFLASLNDEAKLTITYTESNKPFRFGDGNKILSNQAATIPAMIGSHRIFIKTDIITADIPLLLSKSAMKRAQIQLNFKNDTIKFMGEEIPLQTTSNGLYCLPITAPKQLINQLSNTANNDHIILNITTSKTNKDIATKLYRCFAHPSEDRLLKLVNSAGPKWSDNKDLKEEIKKLFKKCRICQMYKKPPPRPVVSLPMASEFQETVAMDLKDYNGHLILHLIDLCTRLSAATFIPNKKKDTIVREIFRIWIAIYGKPRKILVDNGGEFANDEFMQMCDYLGIFIQTTAAESPWSNGIVERNNQTLASMLDKIIADSKCSIQLALVWALNAKNSLQNVAGFSPFQLVLGSNPSLPSTMSDNTPALTMKSPSKVLKENLDAIHKARNAFIACENDERIRRALTHNIRTTQEIKYITGDSVLYKRNDSNEWHGPGTVIGQISQQVFVKHGSFHIRVHSCRLQLVKSASRMFQCDTNIENNNYPKSTQLPPNEEISNNNHQNEHYSSDSDDEINNKAPQEDQNQLSITSSTTTNHIVPKNSITDELKRVRVNTHIRYKLSEETPWTEANVIIRAGKASAKSRNWWNIINSDSSAQSIDLSNITDLQIKENTENMLQIPTLKISPQYITMREI